MSVKYIDKFTILHIFILVSYRTLSNPMTSYKLLSKKSLLKVKLNHISHINLRTLKIFYLQVKFIIQMLFYIFSFSDVKDLYIPNNTIIRLENYIV